MAHHKPLSKMQWQRMLAWELAEQTQPGAMKKHVEYLKETYLPTILKYTRDLPQQAEILEIGCGAACIAQFIEQGHKTYLDPLLDDFRRAFPGELPEGDYLSCMAENIPRPDHSFDCIICIQMISYVHNPELVLHEAQRLLKKDGFIIIGITVYSPLLARLHYWLRKLGASLVPHRPYCYSHAGIRRTLKRHFEIKTDVRLGKPVGVLPWLQHEERLFVCTPEQAD